MKREFIEKFDNYVKNKFQKFYEYNFQNSTNIDKCVNFWKKRYLQQFIFIYLRLFFILKSFEKISSTKVLFDKLKPRTQKNFKKDIETLRYMCEGLNIIVEETANNFY